MVTLQVVRPSILITLPRTPAKRFTQTDMTTQTKQSRGRSILAAASGNVLEWYDFTVYGFMASTIAVLFFPSEDKVASLLSAFAVLAVGYAARPVGSLLFGHIGDRYGRKPVLIASVMTMGLGSVAIAALPTYDQIGITAAVLLVLIRIAQGISVAGEYTTSGVLIVEQAPADRRALTGSWIAFAMMWGCVLGSAVPTLMSNLLTDEQMHSWGWRIPFVFGGLIAFLSTILRRHLSEATPKAQEWELGSPVLHTLKRFPGLIFEMMVLVIPVSVIYFVIFVYAVTYIGSEPGFTSAEALDITTANLVIMAFFVPVCGYIADKVGLRAALMGAAISAIVLALPCWWLMLSSKLELVFIGQLGLTLASTAGWALSITALTQMAPQHLRCSTVAIGYNICLAVFGGTTPFVATYLVQETGDTFAPAYYIVLVSILSAIVIWRIPKHIARAGPMSVASE